MTKPTGRPRGRSPKHRKDAEVMARADGWQDIAQNLGNVNGSRTSGTTYGMDATLPRQTLESMYRGDGLARRVVELPVHDAIREWIDADQGLLDELARLGAKQHITDVLTWARLFGGAVIVALIDDGLDFDRPVRPGGVRRVLSLRVYDRHRVTWTTADIDADPMSENFGNPTVYTVQPIHGAPYRVHASRMYRVDGLSVSEDERQRNNGWGDSALQSVYQALMNYGQTMNASASIVRDFVQTVIGIKGLTDMIRQGSDDLVTKRATMIDLTRSVANTIFFDADGETYDKRASSVTGLPDLWDRFVQHVSSSTGIPITRLTGQSASGLSATGEGDERQWFDVVRAYQTDECTPVVQWLVALLDMQIEWKSADRPEAMEWSWPPLGQPSDAEWAEIRLKNAQADQIYMDRSAVDGAYLFELRHGQGEYRANVTFDHDAYTEWLAERASESLGDDGAVVASPDDKAKEALNGAQIKALQDIALAVSSGQMPKNTGMEIITTSFGEVGPGEAARILDPTDEFTPDDVNRAPDEVSE